MVNLATRAEIAPSAANRRRQNSPNRGHRHRYFHERVAAIVFHDDPPHIAFVDQFFDLPHQVPPQHLDLFDEVLKRHGNILHSRLRVSQEKGSAG